MDVAIHAQLMANNCSPEFQQLILQVPAKYGNSDFSMRLISTLSHSSGMASSGNSHDASVMIQSVAERLLNTAASGVFSIQNDGAMALIRLITHARQMSSQSPEAADEIFSLVRDTVDQELPRRKADLDRQRARIRSIDSFIRQRVHCAFMERNCTF